MLNDRLDQVTGEKGIDTEEGVDGAQSIKQSVKKCECRHGYEIAFVLIHIVVPLSITTQELILLLLCLTTHCIIPCSPIA